MAGFLGTLFMGNVGLRLLLPPKSAYTKMASQFGMGAKKIGQLGLQESRKVSKAQQEELKKRLLTSQILSRKASETNADADIRALQKELQKIDQLTSGKLSKISKGLGADALASKVGTQGKRALGEYDDILGTLQESGGLQTPEDIIDKFEAKVEGLTSGALQAFNNSLSVSVMALTTVGFQVQQVSRTLIEYEKELVNANSIFQVSNDELYQISNEVVTLGLNYALTYDNMSAALYQFASAGLTAAESQEILQDVMKLSMAVQGDSETLGKLMIQVIKGYNMEFSESTKLADQFAITINKSLIEWQDLAAAVKFAMPFFVSTNQEVEQLFGGLAILTDRALEAGIAGRGLRQGLAELAESLGDNTRKFQEMGIVITDAEGNMLQLTEIAMAFSDHFGKASNDTELLTTLIQDLNVRGATAFVHLIQNAEEYAAITQEIADASGDAAEMADKQMESISNQILVTKNAIVASFLYGQVQKDGTIGVNDFHESLLNLVEMIRTKFTIELEDGTYILSQFGFQLREIAISFVVQFTDVIEELLDFIITLNSEGYNLVKMLDLLFVPLDLITGLMELLPDFTHNTAVEFFMLSKMIGGTAAMYFIAIELAMGFNKWLSRGNIEIEKTIGLVESLLGVAITVASILPMIRLGRAAYGGTKAFAKIYGTMSKTRMGVEAASILGGGLGVKAGVGLTAAGYGSFTTAGDVETSPADDYSGMLAMIDNVSASMSAQSSPTTLNVESANFRTDNLNETFWGSQYST